MTLGLNSQEPIVTDIGTPTVSFIQYLTQVLKKKQNNIVGANGTFLSSDTVPKTVTVVNGIITSIV